MQIISASEGLARLTEFEREAIAQIEASTIGFNIVGGLRLAAMLHNGKVRAAEMAGIMHSLFKDSIENAAQIINDGDLERGRLLAERNFRDDDALAVDNALVYGNLNELYRAAKKIDMPTEFTPLTEESVQEMSDSTLTMWAGVMSASLDVLLNEQAERLRVKTQNGEPIAAEFDAAVSSDNALRGAEEELKTAGRKRRVRRSKAATSARAEKSKRRTAQAAKKARKGRKPRGK